MVLREEDEENDDDLSNTTSLYYLRSRYLHSSSLSSIMV